ncbi:MAG: hypothetical protein ABS76_38025 [Pelagibacterium sp. SCN 64-44]|nr:MAG: hypothetical protein ABS76_38025 [Pelagibacterium sp. SCN 64-44]
MDLSVLAFNFAAVAIFTCNDVSFHGYFERLLPRLPPAASESETIITPPRPDASTSAIQSPRPARVLGAGGLLGAGLGLSPCGGVTPCQAPDGG